MRRSHKAFSLIELVIVMAILLLLYAIISPVVFSARLRGKETVCASNLHQVHLALQMYKQDYGDYPNFRPTEQMVPAYVSAPAIYICGVEYRDLNSLDPSSPGFKNKYPTSYGWPCIPSEERNKAQARRGEAFPLVFCDVHLNYNNGTPFTFVLRTSGNVDRVLHHPGIDINTFDL